MDRILIFVLGFVMSAVGAKGADPTVGSVDARTGCTKLEEVIVYSITLYRETALKDPNKLNLVGAASHGVREIERLLETVSVTDRNGIERMLVRDRTLREIGVLGCMVSLARLQGASQGGASGRSKQKISEDHVRSVEDKREQTLEALSLLMAAPTSGADKSGNQ